jgi:hypothetical protein
VYRGKEFPALDGIYFYADYCSGRIWGLRRPDNQWQTKELLNTDIAVSTFGEDEEGNIYFADHRKGVLYKLEAAGRTSSAPKTGAGK